MATNVFLDIGIGNKAAYAATIRDYEDAQGWIARNGPKYSLPSSLEELDDVQREALSEIYPGEIPYEKPVSLIVGRIIIELDPSSGLQKTRDNFITLCKGDRGVCKNAPNKKLHYLGTPIHRIVKDFIAQGGDVTRGDGSGGESIYGGKFNDEKPGLKAKPGRGSIAMANAGKNSNTSQFFFVLATDPAQLKKIEGKYVVFGSVVAGQDVLQKLNDIGTKDGGTMSEVWIENCGVV
ncbi:hypothetical protein DACRYDRAFT_115926 [Dacryopinax primogenitus]|uniref:Peptidyl-prolyl cis-trans isomerase n=1 Tax=Dacryopinax primogenitus (strain DJM 731) TaxID=1858805 RepID=M5G1S0_DACPD|nr:uncharacterized protein DACRYDRAFT_115926 [Dacryopinax primogenitus]EJU02165.1 hypothetical protein DACRYDRAFT_115926 [Dacryopinax primogenitus]